MKLYWLFVCCFLIASRSDGQFRSATKSLRLDNLPSESAYLNNRPSIAGLQPDSQIDYRYSSPWLTFWPGPSNIAGQGYWLGSTTTQSFNKGKFGTIYYYDMLGNMRYARTFIDIAGKNKRGLKLLLPTINQRMFMQH